MKRIERPDWHEVLTQDQHLTTVMVLSKWFDEHIEPLNKMIDEAVEVGGYHGKEITSFSNEYIKGRKPPYKALLINIEPIKKDSKESLLREFIYHLESRNGFEFSDAESFVNRAKKVLEDE